MSSDLEQLPIVASSVPTESPPRLPHDAEGRDDLDLLPLIDKLLDEQRSLTAVEQFSSWHHNGKDGGAKSRVNGIAYL